MNRHYVTSSVGRNCPILVDRSDQSMNRHYTTVILPPPVSSCSHNCHPAPTSVILLPQLSFSTPSLVILSEAKDLSSRAVRCFAELTLSASNGISMKGAVSSYDTAKPCQTPPGLTALSMTGRCVFLPHTGKARRFSPLSAQSQHGQSLLK